MGRQAETSPRCLSKQSSPTVAKKQQMGPPRQSRAHSQDLYVLSYPIKAQPPHAFQLQSGIYWVGQV